jgi:hypothetical protein
MTCEKDVNEPQIKIKPNSKKLEISGNKRGFFVSEVSLLKKERVVLLRLLLINCPQTFIEKY